MALWVSLETCAALNGLFTKAKAMTQTLTMFPSWIRLKMYFHSWICTYVIYCGVAMATGYSINRFQLSIKDTHREFNGGHCSAGSVSQSSSGGGGLCGCTWQRGREMWSTRSKLQQQLRVGKTSSPASFVGISGSQRNCSYSFCNLLHRHLQKAHMKDEVCSREIRTTCHICLNVTMETNRFFRNLKIFQIFRTPR